MNIKVDPAEQIVIEPLAERRPRSEEIHPQQPIQAEDQVELSSQALKLSSLKEMAMAAPDIRSDKIDNIMKQVQDGSYTIDSRLVAERMIQDHMVE